MSTTLLIPADDLYKRNDFWHLVKNGKIPGSFKVDKFGRNDNVPNGSWAHVNLLGSAAWRLTAPTTVRVKAGNAADDSGGAGAREITVQGLDANGDQQTAVLATNGGAAGTASSETFIRVFRAWASKVGTRYSANTGDVIIENGAGGTDLIQIDAGEGQTQFTAYTIPKGYTGFVVEILFSVDGAKPADFKLITYNNILQSTAPYESDRVKHFADGVLGLYELQQNITTVSELSDIWVEARGGGALTEASANFSLYVVSDEFLDNIGPTL